MSINDVGETKQQADDTFDRKAALESLRTAVRQANTDGRDLVEELIAERRIENLRDSELLSRLECATARMIMDYSDFREMEIFPKTNNHKGEVYVLLFDDGSRQIEFYVGQTTRFMGRMDDYFWAEQAAATDFKVGIAVRYFCERCKGRVIVKHKLVDDPRKIEAEILDKLRTQKLPLLNDSGLGYDYRNVKIGDIQQLVYQKCDEITAHLRPVAQ